VTQGTEGVVDTNIIVALKSFDQTALPDTFYVTARMAVLQYAEATFEPLPYGTEAARLYARLCVAVRSAGRRPRGRVADLMIAATAASNGLPLYTANPDDFRGVEDILDVVGVATIPNDL
jgi:hypothetical protein